MTALDKTRIIRFDESLTSNIKIHFEPADDPRSTDIEKFCRDLENISSKISVILDEAGSNGRPAIIIGRGIRFEGVPSGNELEPFLEALAFLDPSVSLIPEQIKNLAKNVITPAEIQIYVSPFCSFCPRVLRDLVPFPFANSLFNLTVTDGTLFIEAAKENDIRSVPTVILDGVFRWTGTFPVDELINVLADRDPSGLKAPALERMITEGGAYDLAQMMLERKTIFPAFHDLLVKENFTVRLGAMVVVEEVADTDLATASQMIEPLWASFRDASDQVKGDILYTLGVLKAVNMIPEFEKIMGSNVNPEIKEAAQEALEKIRE